MKRKTPVLFIVIIGTLLIFFIGLLAPVLYRAKECARMAICCSNLKQLSFAFSHYADNFGGVFPPSLSMLYPDYANYLDIFICQSRKPKVREPDVLNDFTICYEYVIGLTKKDAPESPLIYDREDNHRIGHHRGDRNVVFVNGQVRRVKKKDWPSVLLKNDRINFLFTNPLVWAANQTFVNSAKHIQKDGGIPERYWAKEIRDLHPVRVYIHNINIVVVQHATKNIETGKYICLPISSDIPRRGIDGFIYLSEIKHTDVYNYIRTVGIKNEEKNRKL